MEENKHLESGFRILNILLLESSFNRIAAVTFNNPDIKPKINVGIGTDIKDERTVVVTVQVTYKQTFNEIDEVNASIKMVGMFEKTGVSKLNLEEFGRVNGAAIIYPYVRELLSNLSSKAGLGLIYLPPVNLTTTKN